MLTAQQQERLDALGTKLLGLTERLRLMLETRDVTDPTLQSHYKGLLLRIRCTELEIELVELGVDYRTMLGESKQ